MLSAAYMLHATCMYLCCMDLIIFRYDAESESAEEAEPNLAVIVESDVRFQRIAEDVKQTFRDAIFKAHDFMDEFEGFRQMVLKNQSMDVTEMQKSAVSGACPIPLFEAPPVYRLLLVGISSTLLLVCRVKAATVDFVNLVFFGGGISHDWRLPCLGDRTLDDFRTDIQTYKGQKAEIEKMNAREEMGIVLIEAGKLRDSFMPSTAKCLEEIELLLPELARAK